VDKWQEVDSWETYRPVDETLHRIVMFASRPNLFSTAAFEQDGKEGAAEKDPRSGQKEHGAGEYNGEGAASLRQVNQEKVHPQDNVFVV